jgi:murein DD-endopeptidase MepM/ murein hydrolase activator NlpD
MHLARALDLKEPPKRGELICFTGNTGRSTGPHLHFEIREITEQGETAVDPFLFIPREA